MSNIKLTKQQAEQKVYDLTEKLLFVKKDFKDVAAGYKEKMKEIENEIKENTMVSLGKKYGVSDNSIRKWCKNYGINL